MVPCVIFEDEHLLVVNKPAGMNTPRRVPSRAKAFTNGCGTRTALVETRHHPPAGQGDFRRLVFGKTPAANRSLTEQFTQRASEKISSW